MIERWNVAKNTLRNIIFAFIVGVVLGGGTAFGYYSGLLRNQRSIYNDTLGALAESRRVAEDYRRELDSARRASGEIVNRITKSLSNFSEFSTEHNRAILEVRSLRDLIDELRDYYE
ncbi:hypothetical protein TRIP_E230068 [uncultured Spirochaetota bacterium]|nr:hypothetical protein TRIP_E230068 [uncultured Spirochaetota bacterium]